MLADVRLRERASFTEIQQSDLPHPDLYQFNQQATRKNSQRVHLLLMLALELTLTRSRSTKYHNNDKYRAFHIFCIKLSIDCANHLSKSMRLKFTSEDKHHKDSYKRISSILNTRLIELKDAPRKLSEDGVNHPEVKGASIDHYEFGKKKHTMNINQGGTRTYYLYAFVFGCCTFRMFAQRMIIAFEQMRWFVQVTQAHKVAEAFLPHIMCGLLALELVFEFAIVIRAMFRGHSGYQKLMKDNRPWRLLFAVVSLSLIFCVSVTPICNIVLMAGLDLAHSLMMDFEKYNALKRLQAQLIDNTVDETKDYPKGRLMEPNIRREFMAALSWKITLHVMKMITIFLCLAVLCAGMVFLASNPFVSTICIIVGASCALLNRLSMILKMSDTPGVPKSLEARCESHADPKKKPIIPSSTQRRRLARGKAYTRLPSEDADDLVIERSNSR